MPCKTYQYHHINKSGNYDTQYLYRIHKTLIHNGIYSTVRCWDRLEQKGYSPTYIYKSVPRDDNKQAWTHHMYIHLYIIWNFSVKEQSFNVDIQ
jgi:hypothetical protein